MKRIIVLCFLLVGVTGVLAQTKHTVTKSLVTYQIKNMGFNTDGKFGDVKADIDFDKAHPETSSISAAIEVNSLDSDNEMRDNHLKGADYFDAARHPQITMKSVSIKPVKGNTYTGVFALTIKGKTKNVTMPFTYTENGNTGTFNGSFTLKRTDFGIGGKSLMMADDAKVTVNVQTTF
ncbi:YceI family protein [Mucilaginibacter koreensis]